MILINMNQLTKQELEQLRNIRIHTILGLRDNGAKQIIKCPFHSEKTPSCVIYPDNGYYCYGCKKFGFGAIDFCEDLDYSFMDSIVFLAKFI